MSLPRIAVDAMGGDDGVRIAVEGAALARRRHDRFKFLLVGDESRIKTALENHPNLRRASEILHSEHVVTGEEKPSQALRRARTTSMGMAINARAEFALRIVAVDALHLVEADNAIKFIDHGRVATRPAEVVTSGKQMAGVEAHTDALRLAHALDNFREMLESPADAASLAGGAFEQQFRLEAVATRMHFVDAARDPLNAAQIRVADRNPRYPRRVREILGSRPR